MDRPMAGRPRAVGAGLVLALWLAGCAGGDPGGDGTPGGSAREQPAGDGQARMVALLRQVAADSLVDNIYTGLGQIDDLKGQLAALDAQAPPERRFELQSLLGQHELRVGRTEEAIATFEEARALLPREPTDADRRRLLETLYHLGVAYLRLGETRNCAQRHTADSCLLPIRGSGIHSDKQGSEESIRYLTQVVEAGDAAGRLRLKALWLMNIAYMTLGRYPQDVPRRWRVPETAFAAEEPFPRLHDVAPELGLNVFDLAGGAVVDDFDGDGWLDVLVSTSDPAGGMHLFHNEGDGTFDERVAEAGLEGLTGGLNMVHADYDNDGDPDVLVLRGGWWSVRGRHPNSLLQNDGTGRFRDVTFDAGLGQVHYPTQTADWADYDNDGDVDLFVGNESGRSLRAPCQLFRNEGDGTFLDVAAEAGVENLRYTKAAVWGDYDDDGFPDLYLSNIGGDNRLYHNNGDGTFTDLAPQLGVVGPTASFPAWFWDFDNDGVLDIFVAAYGGEEFTDAADMVASYLRLPTNAERMHLYRGDGRGGFEEVGERQHLTRITFPMGANFGDLDNDGWLDFYLGTGYTNYEALMPNLMYRNLGGSGFADVSTSAGLAHLQKGHGVAFADLDNDGDLDLFEEMGGAYPGDAFGNALYENPGFEAHWIKIKLVGRRSNRGAIGARIRLDVDGPGGRRSIFRHVDSGGSFGSKPFLQEIGLGPATRIERLEVHWPTSGTTQLFTDVAVDQRIEIEEGQQRYDVRPLTAVHLGRAP